MDSGVLTRPVMMPATAAPPERVWLSFAAQVLLVSVIAVLMAFTGGLPSQFAPFYCVPIVIAAGTLPRRFSLGVALLAALCVSPAIDLPRYLLGRELYFADPAPWNLTSTGWTVRALSFMSISIVTWGIIQRYLATMREVALSGARAQEIKVLSLIDKMILSGTSEAESIKQISRFTLELNDAYLSGIAVPANTTPRTVTFKGYYRAQDGPEWVLHEGMPYGEGVAGWALMHGRTSWTRNLFHDTRYQRVAEIAGERGWVACAAAAIVLEGEILGALIVGHDREHDFTPEELEAMERTADQAALAISNSRQRDALQRLALDTATVLSSVIETRDAYTADHCARMVAYADLTATSLVLPPREIELVKLGAALHDVGKIVVPDYILHKPDRLTPEEYAIVKQHCYHGGQICKKVPFLEPVQKLVYHHHEHFDGSGYPDGLSGADIPMGARIIAIADAYDAMTSDRPYRRSLGFDAAADRLAAGAGTQWDPRVIDAFLEAIRRSGLRAV